MRTLKVAAYVGKDTREILEGVCQKMSAECTLMFRIDGYFTVKQAVEHAKQKQADMAVIELAGSAEKALRVARQLSAQGIPVCLVAHQYYWDRVQPVPGSMELVETSIPRHLRAFLSQSLTGFRHNLERELVAV